MCIAYDKQLTIEHILLSCSKFIEMREPIYSCLYMYYFKKYRWKGFLTFSKKSIFLTEYKVSDHFWFWLCATHFLNEKSKVFTYMQNDQHYG